MPEITPYRDQIAPELGSNIGTDAMISAARRVGPLEREAGIMIGQGASAAGRAIGDVLKQRETAAAQSEIASGLEDYALLQGQHNADLQQKLATTHPSQIADVLEKYRADVLDPQNQEWAQNFQTQAGQEWARAHAAQQSAHLLSHARETASTLAADNSVIALNNAKNQFAANAIQDPTSIQRQIDAYTSGVKGLASTIEDPVKRAQFEKLIQHGAGEIAYAAVHTATEVNPSAGRALAQKFSNYLTPEHQAAAQAYADAQTKAQRTQARLDEAAQDRIERRNFGAASNDWFRSIYNPDGSVSPEGMSTAMKGLLDMSRLPGAAQEPGMIRAMANELHRIQVDTARGTPRETDPATYSDLANRQFLDPSDPNHATLQQVAEAHTKGLLSDKDAAMFRQNLDDFAKNPALGIEQKDLTQFLNTAKPADPSQANNEAYFTFEKDRTAKYWAGRRLGIPSQDLLDPKSKDFIGFMSDADKADAAVGAAQKRAPATVMQQKVSSAADLAVVVTNLAKNNSPEDVKTILRGAGMEVPTNFGTGGPWCAPLVNSALKAAGLDPTGSGLASSFKNWGFQVDASNAQKGDVFYVPAEGYTGHVGILTGQKRVGPNGQPQVQVVSSHLQSEPPGGDGGVEWRNVNNMIFRRAKPPLEDIKPGMMGKVWGALKYMTGGAGQE